MRVSYLTSRNRFLTPGNKRRTIAQVPGFFFADNFTYANGNLQAHTPWQYSFPTCASLIGTIIGNQFSINADTVNGDWASIFVSSAPVAKRWQISCVYSGSSDTNPLTGGIGMLIIGDRVIGIGFQRNVSAGAVRVVGGIMASQGAPCSRAIVDLGVAPTVGRRYKVILVPNGNSYDCQFFENSTLLSTGTFAAAGVNSGGQPGIVGSSMNGAQGRFEIDNFVCEDF